MITEIDFETEIDIPGPSTSITRKMIIRQHNKKEAKLILEHSGAEKGFRWDFIVNIEETLTANGKLIGNYVDEFSLII